MTTQNTAASSSTAIHTNSSRSALTQQYSFIARTNAETALNVDIRTPRITAAQRHVVGGVSTVTYQSITIQPITSRPLTACLLTVFHEHGI